MTEEPVYRLKRSKKAKGLLDEVTGKSPLQTPEKEAPTQEPKKKKKKEDSVEYELCHAHRCPECLLHHRVQSQVVGVGGRSILKQDLAKVEQEWLDRGIIA